MQVDGGKDAVHWVGWLIHSRNDIKSKHLLQQQKIMKQQRVLFGLIVGGGMGVVDKIQIQTDKYYNDILCM